MEQLTIYLDLVNELGDPFTIFERIDWPDDSEVSPPEESFGRHVMRE